MGIRGSIKTAALLGIDFILIYYLSDIGISVIITSLMLLYVWLGEYAALIKYQAVRVDHINERCRLKIARSISMLDKNIRETGGTGIENLKVHVIPSDEINAYSFGLHNIAVTQGVLKASDELTLNAILAHEISHSQCMDAVFKRIIFANITVIMLGIIIFSFAVTSFVWGIFWVMCMLGLCGGVVSLFFVSGISKAVKGMFRILQYAVLFIYQAVLGIVLRKFEYRADMYSCILGYEPQMKHFLATYAAQQERCQKTLSEVLYASHPPAYKRIMKMERYVQNSMKAVR